MESIATKLYIYIYEYIYNMFVQIVVQNLLRTLKALDVVMGSLIQNLKI